MQVTLARSGGLQGKREVLGPVDTASLSKHDSDKVVESIKNMDFFELPAENYGPGADLLYHSTTVMEATRTHTVSVNTTSDAPYRHQLGQLEQLILATGAEFSDAP